MVKKIRIRWDTEETSMLQDLGIKTANYVLKEIYIDTSLIALIEDHEGYICFCFSGDVDLAFITDIKFTEKNVKELKKRNSWLSSLFCR